MNEALEIIYRFWWVLVLYFVGAFSPVISAMVYAYAQRRSLQRKLLFVFSVASVSYGAPWVFYFFVFVPLQAAAVFLVPTLYATGHRDELWLRGGVTVYDVTVTWWWVFLPLVLLCWSGVVTAFLGRRWSAITSIPPQRQVAHEVAP